MRILFLSVAFVAALTTPVSAGRNANGALIVHTNDSYNYSETQVCTTTAGEVTSCETATTTATKETNQVIWLLGAWLPAASPCVTVVYFGIDYDDANLFPAANKHCGPAGTVEIPDNDWPFTGRGNSVAFGSPVCGNLFRFYAFRFDGGITGSHFGTMINPTGGYAAFVDDSPNPVLDYCYNFGQVRWNEAGFNQCPQVVGACCYPDGSCVFGPPTECQGTYQGDSTICDPNPCPQPQGACCYPDGSCVFGYQTECQGAYQGDFTTCDPNPCPQPQGACCYPDGRCVFGLVTECHGQYMGDDVPCDPNPCPPPVYGACCYPNGTCIYTIQAYCLTGNFMPDVLCDPNPCPQPVYGACCFPDGSCEFLENGQCTGDLFLPDVPCEPNPCPPPVYGACCYPDGHCEYLPDYQCGTGVFYPDISCVPNPCPPPVYGACCYPDGHCQYLPDYQCGTGVFYPNTPCDPNPCPPPPPPTGACCYQGQVCHEVSHAECEATGGTYHGDGTDCWPNPCEEPCRPGGQPGGGPGAQGTAGMTRPVLYSPRNGPVKPIERTRDICWSEPPDLNDTKISSEIICQYGLISEVANDFILPYGNYISRAIGYGGMYNWGGEPNLTTFNFRWYRDAGCYPGDLYATYYGMVPDQTFIGYDGYGYPTYKLESWVGVSVSGGTLYWFSLQATDHAFPPQWGSQGTGGIVTNCDTVFKSAFFGYPDWTPAGGLVGWPYDAAQEFDCGGATPVKSTTWGKIKVLFR